MAKKNTTPKEVKLEDVLMNCRNSLRGKASMTDKRDLLLTLVFFKFIGDRFEERRSEILEEYASEPELAAILQDDSSSYGKDGIFYLKEECRWSYLVDVEQKGMAVAFDNAITTLDNEEPTLKNALPRQIFTNTALEPSVLKQVVDEVNKIDKKKFQERDLIGRVYEYFLQAFSINADKEEGEFYTPHSIVELIATLIEPFDGTIYDPCCGSGGMFVQSAKFIEAHGGNTRNINVYGQEQDPNTYRLAKMNLAIRGISYDLGNRASSTFTDDQHGNKKMDYIMANPPFNLKKWRPADTLTDDYRWKGYGVPPESNANYAWILHILSKLNPSKGIAGFLLANTALDDQNTLTIRQKLIENDKIEAIINLPRNMFYGTPISVTLWILNNNKKGGLWHGRKLRDRRGEILFIDLRTLNSNVYEKKFIQFSTDQIADICKIYFDWQTMVVSKDSPKYEVPELYYSAGIDEIKSKKFTLVVSRYIKFIDKDSDIDYQKALTVASSNIHSLLNRQQTVLKESIDALKSLGI